MSLPLVIAIAIVLVVFFLWLLVRFGLPPADLLDVNQDRRSAQRMAVEAEDMRQLLELANRQRRLAGKPELTEDELRYGRVD